MGDPVYVRKGMPLSDYEVIFRDWLANTVRISVHPTHWRHNHSALMAALTADVAAARAAGLYVILDWHAVGFPGGYVMLPDPAWGLPQDAYWSDLPTAAAFWTEMARTFGSDPGIIFELWNEPVVDDRLDASTGQHWPQLKRAWLTLIESIRSKSDNIILAAGDRFAFDLKGVSRDLIDDPRTAYAWHCYPNMDRDKPSAWANTLDGLSTVKPVVVTEWGFDADDAIFVRGTAEGFGAAFTETALEALKLHSTAWVWSWQSGPRMLNSDRTETDFGRFVHDYLRRAANR